MPAPLPIAILHLDESCLGNGQDRATPGGAAGLIEVRSAGAIQRRDFYIHAPDTTNNRMALAGAIAGLQLLAGKGKRLKALLVSDSEYLVKGMRDWVPAWRSRGWTRKGGQIENLELWRVLVDSAARHEAQWTWVRGHQGHPKNEYANDLAVKAATDQVTSQGAVESGFGGWLSTRQAKGQFPGYDPDLDFTALERRLAGGEQFPLADAAD
ncbi:MAG: ribonuclease HI [Gemmatimonadota bacterium]|nr:ribonuclease HI [Gemmatimonadota bacterium]MDH4348970.1 ribonuclease HI [Gemmatimonadota bacterium]MDH5282253.1 ribonuclease HI [Gemmatimonadota bacterium]